MWIPTINFFRQIAICSLVGILCITNVQAQSVKGFVYDDESKFEIQSAFIFINDSSIGTITDESGFFEIDTENHTNVDLIVSHLGYENQTFRITGDFQNLDTIFLVPESVEIKGVSLTKKYSKKLRKRRMKRFKDAFLGSEDNRKNVEITNPNTLLFYMEGSRLMATATEPLIIENKHLGYSIRFFLSHFELHSNADCIYKGKSSFSELALSKKALARAKRNRRKIFSQTYRSFFYRLIHDTIPKDAFIVGTSKQNFRGEFVQFDPVELDSLSLEMTDDSKYILDIENHFTVKYLDMKVSREASPNFGATNALSKIQNPRGIKNDQLTSYLGSKTGKLILDSNGRILNANEVEEYGFWASKRVAYMLPLDYKIKP